MSTETQRQIALADQRSAHNYHPLPVVLATGEGAWVTDVEGRRYLDFLAGYSALNFGHRHPRLVDAAKEQMDRLTLVSRAFHHDQFGPFCAELAELTRKDSVLAMNSGAEAVETAIKLSRKWGYRVKGVPDGQATIVVAEGNFHGRTTTIVSFSTDDVARADYGPYTPGFRIVPYGDAEALAAAVDDTTVAVLLEPIQGEAGVHIPPPDYLRAVRELCTERGVLFVADEIQSGLGRTGTTFACDLAGVEPDVYVLGKALGGGILPLSAIAASWDIMRVFQPGQHGSTFGGNPLACAVGRAVVEMLQTGEYQAAAQKIGVQFRSDLEKLIGHGVTQVRSVGLWAGIDVEGRTGREVCERLLDRGVLAKETHGQTIRLAPPLVISPEETHWAVEQLAAAVSAG